MPLMVVCVGGMSLAQRWKKIRASREECGNASFSMWFRRDKRRRSCDATEKFSQLKRNVCVCVNERARHREINWCFRGGFCCLFSSLLIMANFPFLLRQCITIMLLFTFVPGLILPSFFFPSVDCPMFAGVNCLSHLTSRGWRLEPWPNVSRMGSISRWHQAASNESICIFFLRAYCHRQLFGILGPLLLSDS